MYRVRNLYEGMSEEMSAYGRAEKCVESGRLYDVHGLHPRLSDDGDPDEDAGKEPESKIQE